MSDIFTRSTRTSKTSNFVTPGRAATLFGVFVGFVKDNTDVQRMGRLRVWIPEFGSLPADSESWITVNYCSPFAGATNPDTEDQNDLQNFEGTQTSYGMWFVPPDLENQVLVMFINGDGAKGIWIGSLYQQYMNQMIPAVASSFNNYQYGVNNAHEGHTVPVAEYNKWNTDTTDPQNVRRPYSKTRFRGLGNQGLITDPIRGTTTTSARREAPSQVYGILTPGPLQPDGTVPGRRMGGSSFIMDDGTNSEYVQLMTKTGAQVRIDETNGFIFLINRDGTSWIQMDKEGHVDIFGANDVSVRSQKDINFRADRNINIEAGQNIYMKAAKDTVETTSQFTYDVNGANTTKTIPFWAYKGEGKGDGGNIVVQALNNLQTTIQSNAFFTVKENNLNILINNGLTVTTNTGGQEFNSNKGIKFTTGGAFDLGATGKIRIGSNADISVSAGGFLTLCAGGQLGIKAGADVVASSASFKVGASDIVLNAGSTKIGGGTVDLAPPGMPSAGTPTTPDAAQTSVKAPSAEVKPLNNKINILPDWLSTQKFPDWAGAAYREGDQVKYQGSIYSAKVNVPPMSTFSTKFWELFVPQDKFVRNSEPMGTTVSRLITFEPCPENAGFKVSTTNGYIPPVTVQDQNYQGSAGNPNAVSPNDSDDPASTNTEIRGDGIEASAAAGDMNLKALQCQLAINEGVVYHSYYDSRGLPTGGIGHLLTKPTEINQYPVKTNISQEQVEQWFNVDVGSAIRGAQRVLGLETWDKLNDTRKRAVTDLTYNLGEAGLSKFKDFIASMKVEDYIKAGSDLVNSAWFNQVGQRGPRIVQMISTGTDPMNWCEAADKIIK